MKLTGSTILFGGLLMLVILVVVFVGWVESQ